MTLNLDNLGKELVQGNVSWTSKDAIIYSLGVGAGLADPLKELQFTTENSIGVEQQLFPTHIVTLKTMPLKQIGDFPLESILHGIESISVHKTFPVEGTVHIVAKIVGFYDKGADAVIELEFVYSDPETGEKMATLRDHVFLRGQGGWGGDRGPSTKWAAPDRAPDRVLTAHIPDDQALLYRLAGDRHRLHSDPVFAADAGFAKPILHGLCTYGFAARLLLDDVFDGDVDRFGEFTGRFSSPVFPGETMVVKAWDEPGETAFVVTIGDRTVIDRGRMTERA